MKTLEEVYAGAEMLSDDDQGRLIERLARRRSGLGMTDELREELQGRSALIRSGKADLMPWAEYRKELEEMLRREEANG